MNSKYFQTCKRIEALIFLLSFSLISCLGYREDRVAIQKNQIGTASEIVQLVISPPDATGNFLEFSINRMEEIKYETKVKVTTSLLRNKNGTLCDKFTNSGEEEKCVSYYASLGLGTFVTAGLWIPIALVFDWIPAIFRTGDSIVTEESTEKKSSVQCNIKNSEAVFEYGIGGWDKTRKVQINNCVAKVPLNDEFNSNYSMSYRVSITGASYASSSLNYSTDGGAFGVIESKRFLAIQKNADRILEREDRINQLTQEVESKKEKRQCLSFMGNISIYSPIRNYPKDYAIPVASSCQITCLKMKERLFSSDNTGRVVIDCTERCRQCWDVLGWEKSGRFQL
ncbi:hypothetical protein [Leptospira barantonii]|uniref:Lipoprotein n=1 Tax=Leptospira barantonii TaxID=2023184 RepID=A0ABX4NN72_9LEPT|nr:hypothetical protein [Leptospira barantonii]PJZ58277.1 hypothetical protein CH367_07820 [Leptospira barantonii]